MSKPTIKHKKSERINTGESTNALIHSAHVATNDEVFPMILDLFVPTSSKVADVTYGKGVFWKKVNKEDYDLFFSDIKTKGLPEGCVPGIDSTSLPYEDESFDALVFDPPYMHTPGGTAHNGHQNFEQYYANNGNGQSVNREKGKDSTELPKYHEAVLDLYYRSALEAYRVLKKNGIYIVKCQDEVCSNKQRLTHLEITIELQNYGFITEDLFVVVRKNKPGVSRMKKQYHARKNHSYFMIYRKL